MFKILKTAAVVAIFAVSSSVGAVGIGRISPTILGFASALDLADTPATTAIRMDDRDSGYYTRLSLVMTVVWGTSTEMIVKCKASADGTNYGWVQRCTSESTHNCEDRKWKWEPTDGTTFTLDLETNYSYVICQADDAADGTGTVVIDVMRGR